MAGIAPASENQPPTVFGQPTSQPAAPPLEQSPAAPVIPSHGQSISSHADIDPTAPIKTQPGKAQQQSQLSPDDDTHPLNRIVTGGVGPSAHIEDTHGSLAVPEELLAELAVANRILANQNVVDSLGHISMRHPTHPTTHFLLARNTAPGLVLSADIVVYRIADGEPELGNKAPHGYAERYIHSELYKRYAPEHVSAVAHVHTESLLPFGLAPKLPFKAMVRTSGFLGHAPAPVFDIAEHFGTETDLLIRSPAIGAQLARAFEPRVEVEPTTSKTEKKKSGLFSRSKKPVEEPVTSIVKPRNLVLQRGHGATIVAPSLKLAVQRAIYADKNARVQLQLHSLLGGLSGLSLDTSEHQGVTALHEQEAILNEGFPQIDRAWAIWSTQAMSGY